MQRNVAGLVGVLVIVTMLGGAVGHPAAAQVQASMPAAHSSDARDIPAQTSTTLVARASSNAVAPAKHDTSATAASFPTSIAAVIPKTGAGRQRDLDRQ